MFILTIFLLYSSGNSIHLPFSGWWTRPGTRRWRWRTRGARPRAGAPVSTIITPPLHPSTVQWAQRAGGEVQAPPPQRLRPLERLHPAGGAVRRQQHRTGQRPVITAWVCVCPAALNPAVVVVQERLSGIQRRSEGGKWGFWMRFAAWHWARFDNLNGFAGRRLDGFMFCPFDRRQGPPDLMWRCSGWS